MLFLFRRLMVRGEEKISFYHHYCLQEKTTNQDEKFLTEKCTPKKRV